MRPHELTEERETIEIILISQLTDGDVGQLQIQLDELKSMIIDHIQSSIRCLLLDHLREMLGGDEELLGIIRHRAMTPAILLQQLDEHVEDRISATCRRHILLGDSFARLLATCHIQHLEEQDIEHVIERIAAERQTRILGSLLHRLDQYREMLVHELLAEMHQQLRITLQQLRQIAIRRQDIFRHLESVKQYRHLAVATHQNLMDRRQWLAYIHIPNVELDDLVAEFHL